MIDSGISERIGLIKLEKGDIIVVVTDHQFSDTHIQQYKENLRNLIKEII